MHLPGHLLLTLGADFTTHGLMLNDEIYQSLCFYSHVLNSQELLLSLQLISTTLHGSSFHRAIVYISDSIECIVILPKWNIHPDIFI